LAEARAAERDDGGRGSRDPAKDADVEDDPKTDQTDRKPPAKSWAASLREHSYIVATVLVVVLAAIVGGILYWLHARQFESTDDAFIDARTVSISPQVPGGIVEVPVTDNERLETGAVLVRIDDRDYRAALSQATAQVEQANASITNLDAQIEAQQARVSQAEQQVSEARAALEFAGQENERYQDLLRRGAGTQQRAQQASSDLQQRQGALSAAQANLTAAQKQVTVLQSQRDSAKAQLDAANAGQAQAQANLSRTTIAAPTAGRVTRISAAKGGYATTGQVLLMFVPETVWVTANFKETQLTHMRVNQPVDIRIDAFPGRLFRGHVDSLQAGSGTAFSLLPAENATGNYVKVVQRIPVKIVFDETPDVLLGPGMSVVPTVKVR
jgi:membrane fusion protein (multidrug efflux system)